MINSLLVPQPTVTVTLNRTTALYAGTGLTLTCIVALDPSVNNNENVGIEWSDLQRFEEERYSINATSRESGDNILTIDPLAELDSGVYTCTVTVTGGNNVLSVTTDGHVTISVFGK